MELFDRILSLLKEICSELTYLKCILGKFLHVLERIQFSSAIIFQIVSSI